MKYHDIFHTVQEAVQSFERTKTGAQVFRFARLVLVGVATAAITHNGVDTATVVAVAEVAFRQVFD